MFANRVKETTSTTGTGSFTTTGAVSGFETFNTAFGLNFRFTYWARDETANTWETGIGYLSGATTLVREAIEDNSSDGTTAINFANAPSLFCGGSESSLVSLAHACNNSILPGYTMSAHLTEESVDNTMAANRIYYMPFLFLGKKSTFSGFQIRINTASASSSVRASLYDATPDFKPGNKLITVTTDFDTSTTGTKTQACTATDIFPGWYFLAYSSDATPAIAEASQMVMCPLGVNSSNAANKCYTENAASIAHPATPTLAGATANYGVGQIGLNIA